MMLPDTQRSPPKLFGYAQNGGTHLSFPQILPGSTFTVNPNEYDLFTQLTSNPVVLESNSWTQIASFSMCKEVLFLF